MRLQRILVWTALAVAGLVAIIFSLDLAIALPFSRFSWATDLIVLIASGLLIWQSIETLREL